MILLSLETSCDETASSVIKLNEKNNSFEILSNIVSSQIKIHAPWGGVVPMLAAREHLKNILPVIQEALEKSQTTFSQINLLAVTQGPGLIPALLLGVNAMKTLAYFSGLPLLGVHHIEGHLCANEIKGDDAGRFFSFAYPILSLVVSGGHTQLILEKSPRQYEIVSQTLDDAAGEAFDKIAKMLGLGYPGGPIVSQKAQEAERILGQEKDFEIKKAMQKLSFPRPMLKSDDLNFSFSGLKTSVLYFWQKLSKQNLSSAELGAWKIMICDQFQKSVVDVLTQKSLLAIRKYCPKTFLLAGGVAANQSLRESLQKNLNKKFPSVVFQPPRLDLCGDNAAMIGVTGGAQYLLLKKRGRLNALKNNWKDLSPDANLKL